MCGIVGYLGQKKALPFLLNSLKSLEYRGYDSCGLVLIEKRGRLQLVRVKGEVDRLIQKSRDLKTQATIGLGHTRWATHGRPSIKNAHPHLDCQRKIALVHNGIIENFKELKEDLLNRGHLFRSETDTEVLVHLIEEELETTDDLKKAVAKALRRVRGAYGVAVVSSYFPEQIVAARLSSPLIIGLGKGENFLASDQPALIGWTKNFIILDDFQIAVIKKDGVAVSSLTGGKVAKKVVKADNLQPPKLKKNLPHYTLKEIYEQPETISRGLAGRFLVQQKKVKLGGIEADLKTMADYPFLTIVANGSSFHAGLLGQCFFESLARKTTLVRNAAQLNSLDFRWQEKQPVIFVSQSGETADVLKALQKAKREQALVYGLVNTVASSVARQTRAGIYARAGYEIGVASTKAFTSQVLAFLLWALSLAEIQGLKPARGLLAEIKDLPAKITATVKLEPEIKKIAQRLKSQPYLYLVGRGLLYPLALEGALKIKELSYLPSEGLPTGEFKHGPLALIDKKTLVIALVAAGSNWNKDLNNLHEIASRGSQIVILTNKQQPKVDLPGLSLLELPPSASLLSVFPFSVCLQLLAYWLARYLKRPIDKPRNLAKSVTVE